MASHILPPLPALLLMLCLLALSVRSLNFPFQKQMKVTLLKTILDLGKFYFWFHTIRSWRVGINSLHKFCCRNDGINIKIKSNVGQIEVFFSLSFGIMMHVYYPHTQSCNMTKNATNFSWHITTLLFWLFDEGKSLKCNLKCISHLSWRYR